MFDPRPLCCSSLTTAVGGTTDTNFVDSAHPTVARIRASEERWCGERPEMAYSWVKNSFTSRRAGSRRDVTEDKQVHVATSNPTSRHDRGHDQMTSRREIPRRDVAGGMTK